MQTAETFVIVDPDAFYHTAWDQVFSTPVGVAEYLPPELQKFHRDGRLADAQRTHGGEPLGDVERLDTGQCEDAVRSISQKKKGNHGTSHTFFQNNFSDTIRG